MISLSHTTLVILGAGRSGTNMLRDLLTECDGVATWPCDEINYIWRHGNARYPTDEFPPALASPRVRAFIRGRFDRMAAKTACRHLVEKTCANTLRVGFVNEVIPEARYLHIIRDGRDVAVSARERWTAAMDIPYILRKARYVPKTDLPYYAGKYIFNRMYALASGRKRLAAWGPRFEGMQEIFSHNNLHVACALQWQRCVNRAATDLDAIGADRVLELRYEDFVQHPVEHVRNISAFTGIAMPEETIARLAKRVRPSSAGRYTRTLDPETIELIEDRVGDTLTAYDYR
jgi:hypothetical protein